MKTIPEIRERLLEIALEVQNLATRRRRPLQEIADEIKELAQSTRRRPAVYRTERRTRSKQEREKLHDEVRAYALQHPNSSYLDLSLQFDVPTSNIAIALNGSRENVEA